MFESIEKLILVNADHSASLWVLGKEVFAPVMIFLTGHVHAKIRARRTGGAQCEAARSGLLHFFSRRH